MCCSLSVANALKRSVSNVGPTVENNGVAGFLQWIAGATASTTGAMQLA